MAESGPRPPRAKTVGKNPADNPVMVENNNNLFDPLAIEDLVEELPDRAEVLSPNKPDEVPAMVIDNVPPERIDSSIRGPGEYMLHGARAIKMIKMKKEEDLAEAIKQYRKENPDIKFLLKLKPEKLQ